MAKITTGSRDSQVNMTSKFLLFLMGFGVGVIGMFLFNTRSSFIPPSIFFVKSSPSPDQLIIPVENHNLPKIFNRRFAIFAASIHSKIYSYVFYAPITAAAWQRVGYEVIFVFAGDFTSNSSVNQSAHLILSRTLLQRLGVHVLDFQCNISYDVKMSQILRMFGGFLPDNLVHDDDNIITTDSDLLPLKKSEYEVRNGADGFIFNAKCCGSFERRGKSYPMFPMGHICLSKKTWRNMILESIQHAELVNQTSLPPPLLSEHAPFSFDTINLYAQQEFGAIFSSKMTKGDAAWYMDQILASMMLSDYRTRHPDVIIDERAKTQPRLDPGYPHRRWEPSVLPTYGDAHLIHDEIFDSFHWSPFTNMLKFLFNATLVNDFTTYYRKFVLVLRDKSSVG